jgi:type II secretory pathway component GspD/PulD (secretin)
MKPLPHRADRVAISVAILAALALPMTLIAQDTQAETKRAEAKNTPRIVETIHLKNVTAQRDLNDLQTDLRNMLPMAAMYTVATQNAISISATPDDMEAAKKLIAELDRPRKAYRITYTITEVDNGKRTGSQRLAMVVVEGEKSTVKHGSRVPIVTGVFAKESPGENSQVQYLDVGLNIEAFLDGDRLRSKVEQTGVAEEKSGIGAQDPIVRQTTIEATSDMASGKTVMLGSLDIPGTTRHQEIEATAEPVQ